MKKADLNLDSFIEIAKALSDPSRVRALMALRKGELCVCQIIELLGLAPSTVSKHMSILKMAGLVEGRKEERWMYYRLPGESANALINRTLEWSIAILNNDRLICKDAASLETIKQQDPSNLCKTQRINT